MKPKYKDIKFKTKAEFENWLKEITHFKVHLQDNGQDFQEAWLSKEGEIIHCDLQSYVWNGRFVDLKRLKPGKGLILNDVFGANERKWTEMKFIVEKVTKLK